MGKQTRRQQKPALLSQSARSGDSSRLTQDQGLSPAGEPAAVLASLLSRDRAPFSIGFVHNGTVGFGFGFGWGSGEDIVLALVGSCLGCVWTLPPTTGAPAGEQLSRLEEINSSTTLVRERKKINLTHLKQGIPNTKSWGGELLCFLASCARDPVKRGRISGKPPTLSQELRRVLQTFAAVRWGGLSSPHLAVKLARPLTKRWHPNNQLF